MAVYKRYYKEKLMRQDTMEPDEATEIAGSIFTILQARLKRPGISISTTDKGK